MVLQVRTLKPRPTLILVSLPDVRSKMSRDILAYDVRPLIREIGVTLCTTAAILTMILILAG